MLLLINLKIKYPLWKEHKGMANLFRLKRFAIPLVDRQLMRNIPGIRAPFVGDLLRKKGIVFGQK